MRDGKSDSEIAAEHYGWQPGLESEVLRAQRRNDAAAALPAWLVLNVVADAIVDARWGQYDPADGGDPEVWALAKEGDVVGTRDELVDGLLAMEERGWIRLDWDADPPEPKIINAATVIREEAP